jgi:hypothetical protein
VSAVSDVIAIYAVTLSTVLAAAKVAEWALISLERADPDDSSGVVHLRVINPAKRTLVIEGNRQFPRSAPPLRIADQTPLNRALILWPPMSSISATLGWFPGSACLLAGRGC